MIELAITRADSIVFVLKHYCFYISMPADFKEFILKLESDVDREQIIKGFQFIVENSGQEECFKPNYSFLSFEFQTKITMDRPYL